MSMPYDTLKARLQPIITSLLESGAKVVDITNAIKDIAKEEATQGLPLYDYEDRAKITPSTLVIWSDREILKGSFTSIGIPTIKIPEGIELPEFTRYHKGSKDIFLLTIIQEDDERYEYYNQFVRD